MNDPEHTHDAVTSASDQTGIRALFMRGGTSRGPFFLGSDLPEDTATRDNVLLSVMGTPHPLQVDGLGGGHPLTSKVGIVTLSPLPDVDIDFEFAQLQPNDTSIQTTANCGNMLAAAAPFAVETGLVIPDSDSTEVTVRTVNTGLIATITVRTPLLSEEGVRTVAYAGETAIDGVEGTSSPVSIMFVNTAGSIAPSLMPTGNPIDALTLPDGSAIEATMIDNGQPLVLLRASDLCLTGAESASELSADSALSEKLEHLRLAAGELMELGDVADKNYPKMTLLSPPIDGGTIATRSFIPHSVHQSIGVLAALTVATAAYMEGTIAHPMSAPGDGELRTLNIEHPSGAFPVNLQIADGQVVRSGLTRTARLLMSGRVFVPASTWDPSSITTATQPEGTPH